MKSSSEDEMTVLHFKSSIGRLEFNNLTKTRHSSSIVSFYSISMHLLSNLNLIGLYEWTSISSLMIAIDFSITTEFPDEVVAEFDWIILSDIPVYSQPFPVRNEVFFYELIFYYYY